MNPVAPFEFKDCALIALSTGKSAQNLRELHERIGEVPLQSLLHHFHETLLRPSFDDPEYPNDFAVWARRSLHDAVLAERMGIVDPLDFEDPDNLRLHILDVVEDRLAEAPYLPAAAPGHEFRFLRSQIVIFSGNLRAETPGELRNHMPALSTGSIFYHFVEARRRNPGKLDDFTLWLRQWEEPWHSACDSLTTIGFHHVSLAETRERIADCLRAMREPQEVS